MEDAFRRVVEHVFNNWTALKLAVEHSMGGPNSRMIATECVDYMTQFCIYENDVDVNDIEDALEDIMDQEFDTICEDGSMKEIATMLHRFLNLVRVGNIAAYETEFHKLPVVNGEWLAKSKFVQEPPVEINRTEAMEDVSGAQCSNSSSNNESAMEEDSDWTPVKSKRKKLSDK